MATVSPRQIAMGKLAAFFPLGASKDRTEMYLEHRWLSKVQTPDLVEAVERLSVTRAEKSFPTLAVLLRVCGDAAGARRAASQANADADHEHRRPPTSDEIDQCEKLRALARRGVFYCDTCQDFVQAERGVNGRGWDPCHYRENRALWAAGTDRRMMRDVLHRSWEQFNKEPAPPLELDLVEGFNGLGDVVADLPF